MPASLATVVVTVAVSDWATIGQVVYVQNAGWMRVTAKPSTTQITLQNLETATDYTENVAPTTVVPLGSTISPGGLQGPSGIVPGTTLNSISPTTTKGDVLVDNGASSPAASLVRFGVGANGRILVADSTQAVGLNYKAVIPNAVTSDNVIPRYDGATGTPVPIQDSGMLIADGGAIQSTPSGGNARGANAIDLQVDRNAATQVASGQNSTLAGGQRNTASAAFATASGGFTNVASANSATVSGGASNTASASHAAVGGGLSNSAAGLVSSIAGGNTNSTSAAATEATVGGGNGNAASATYATISGGISNAGSGSASAIGGGQANAASGIYSAIPGGSSAAANKWGQMAHASGQFAAVGDAQTSEVLLRNVTTDGSTVGLFLDGGTLPSYLTVPNNTTWLFSGYVVGRSNAGNSKIWSVVGGIKNNAGVVTVVAAATVTALFTDAGVWSNPTATAGVNTDLSIQVTGTAATTIRWLCWLRLVEVAL